MLNSICHSYDQDTNLLSVVDEFNSECTDSQLNAEHWFARIKKLYNQNICLIIINHYLTYRCRLCIKILPTHLTNKTEINRKSTF